MYYILTSTILASVKLNLLWPYDKFYRDFIFLKYDAHTHTHTHGIIYLSKK